MLAKFTAHNGTTCTTIDRLKPSQTQSSAATSVIKSHFIIKKPLCPNVKALNTSRNVQTCHKSDEICL